MRLRVKACILIFSLLFCGTILYAQSFPPTPPYQHPHPHPKGPPPKNPDKILKYRGTRTYNENLPLKIIQTKCAHKENEMVYLEIIFNQSINPRSVKPYNILINNKPLSPGVRFAFSKKGDRIKIILPMKVNSFKLKVLEVKSFGGAVIDPIELLVEVRDSL